MPSRERTRKLRQKHRAERRNPQYRPYWNPDLPDLSMDFRSTEGLTARTTASGSFLIRKESTDGR